MTPFGKAVRKLRIEHDMLLGAMAEVVDLSASYLSQIETGKRQVPIDLPVKISRMFNLPPEQASSLKQLAAQSMTDVSIKLGDDATVQDRMLATNFALAFARLNPEEKRKIQILVEGGDQ